MRLDYKCSGCLWGDLVHRNGGCYAIYFFAGVFGFICAMKDEMLSFFASLRVRLKSALSVLHLIMNRY